jgi:hydrogenase maturation protease
VSARILVAGVGNVFFGDDGFGCAAARRLLERGMHGNVRVVDFGIGSIHLSFELLEGYEMVVIMDATARGGAPGTVYVIEPDLEDAREYAAPADAHTVDPDAVLALIAASPARPRRVVVVGCEPETMAPGMELSGPVMGAVERACDAVAEIVEREPVGER